MPDAISPTSLAARYFHPTPAVGTDAEICLASLACYHDAPCEGVRLHGPSMLDAFNALTEMGLLVRGLKGTMTALRTLDRPSLLHVGDADEEKTFVVCFGYESGKFVIGDPRRGTRRWTAATLSRRWSSRALLVVDGKRPIGEERFRSFSGFAAPFGLAGTLHRARATGASCMLTRVESEALIAARLLRTLEGHEAWMTARGIGILEGGEPRLDARLDQWLDAGLLVSETFLRDAVLRNTVPTDAECGTGITSICIPTQERPAALERALRGYMSNARDHGRTVRFVVAQTTSTESNEIAAELLGSLREKYGFETYHLESIWKQGMVDDLAVVCPASVLRFALFGNERCGSNYGANRNALLLATIGELTVHVDDDTVVPGFGVPDLQPGIALSSKFDPNGYWFEESKWEPAGSVDVLQLHESMLGRHPGSLLRAYGHPEIDVDEMEVPLYDRLQRTDARMVMTFVGHDGDVGTASNAWRLFLEGASLARLVRPGYAKRLRQRDSARTVLRRTISDGSFCAAMHLGLDNRVPLPPFMPTGRNEDGVFSAAVSACLPESLRGFREGYVIRHRPVEKRAPFPASVRFEGLKANDLIALLIRELSAGRPSGMSVGTAWLGRALESVGTLEQTEFDEVIRDFVRRTVGLGVAEVEHAITDRAPISADLAADLSTYLQSMEAFVIRADCDVPIDLDGSTGERRRLLRELIRSYGELLTYWPDIVQRARSFPVHPTREHIAFA